jgi:Sulfotransferase domain
LLPTFMMIGAMKSGTTSLARYLSAHPDVFMTRPKEPGFFNPARNWNRGFEWYENLFKDARANQARGEASTSYTMAPRVSGVPERIAAAVPDVKLIYLIRNPIDRIRSMYMHLVDRGEEFAPLKEAVHGRDDYLDISRYGYQLEQYLLVFPRDRLMVVSSDALRHRRIETMESIFRFIDVDPDVELLDVSKEYHRGDEKRRIWPAMEGTRSLLRRSGLMRHVPKDLKFKARTALSTQVPTDRAEIDDELADYLWSVLAEDLKRLRAIVGPDFELWGKA